MKVLLLNGSPHPKRDTYTALSEVEKGLNRNGIETEIFHVPADARPCADCGACRKNGRCIYQDGVDEVIEKLNQYDGLVIGSPVYFASPAGGLIGFLDRMFTRSEGFAGKPAAAIAVARRAGTSATLDALLKYPSIAEMPIVTSQYWPNIHGCSPEQVMKDEEGLQIMRRLGDNMAWLIKCIHMAKERGIAMPPHEEQGYTTNFIGD